MSQALKCDRCGKLYECYEGVEFSHGGNKFRSLIFLGKGQHKSFDLCEDCMKDAKEWTKRIPKSIVNFEDLVGRSEQRFEDAYADCKKVFDGIVDDRSFQDADSGLVFYYRNEILYSLQHVISDKYDEAIARAQKDLDDIRGGDK